MAVGFGRVAETTAQSHDGDGGVGQAGEVAQPPIIGTTESSDRVTLEVRPKVSAEGNRDVTHLQYGYVEKATGGEPSEWTDGWINP